jgi:hypothetical protein
MKKILKGLLVTILAVSQAHIVNASHTDQTFLMPRPVGVDLPMEYCTFDSLIGRKNDDKFGGNFQVTGFYKNSTNSEDTAKYFLINKKSTITLTRTINPTPNTVTTDDVELGYLLHNCAVAAQPGNTPYSANLSLDPKINSYGVRVDYHQDLDMLLKGLYLKANLPFAYIETNVNVTASSTTKIPAVVTGAPADQPTNDALLAYLNGSFANTVLANQQIKLDHAKITGEQSATGIADIDLALGYKFLSKPSYYASLAFALTIPTGNAIKGLYVFEPLYGNGQHLGIGVDMDAQSRAWGDDEHNIKINLFLKYRYLFKSHETRTLQIKDRPFSRYFLLGSTQSAALIPAANVLTQNVDITPGSQLDGILGVTYNNGGVVLDFGYNMYFREGESMDYRGGFNQTYYQIAARSYAASAALFTITGANTDDSVTTPLTIGNLDISGAQAPSQFTNAIYGGLGYYCDEWDIPLMFGLGGKYEFASSNAAIEQWTVYGKIGVGF